MSSRRQAAHVRRWGKQPGRPPPSPADAVTTAKGTAGVGRRGRGDGVGVTSDGEEIDVMRRPVRGRHGAAVHAEAEKKKGLRLVP